MVNCEHLADGTCGLVASLCGLPIDVCHVREDACAACLATSEPKKLNSVTASLAIGTAARHLEHDKAAEIRTALVTYITVVRPKTSKSSATGPGTELKRLLGRLGLHEKPGCGCKARAREMDHRGISWCEGNVDTIVGWLREEAKRQSLPFVEIAARALIRYAIRRAKK